MGGICGIRSYDEMQVQRFDDYRNRILQSAGEGNPGIEVRGDEYSVTKEIPMGRPAALPGAEVPGPHMLVTDRYYEARDVTIMPGTHIHKSAEKGDQIVLNHDEKEYMPVTPVAGLERLNEDWYVAKSIGIIFPVGRTLHHQEIFRQKEAGLKMLGGGWAALERSIALDTGMMHSPVTMTYDMNTGELLNYSGPDGAKI